MRDSPSTAAAVESAAAVGSILGDERDDVTPDFDPGGWRFAAGRLPA